MARVIKRPAADVDLLLIWDFIARDNLEAADNYLRFLETKFQLIATQPQSGRVRDELKPNLRSFPIGNYVVFYYPLEDGIAIERVLQGSQDIAAQFNDA